MEQTMLNRSAGFLRGYERVLFAAVVLLMELRMFIGTYLYILPDRDILFRTEIRAGEFVALGFLVFLILTVAVFPHAARQAGTVMRRFGTFDYGFLFFLPFWYLFICVLRQRVTGSSSFRENEWWIYITAVTSFVFFPFAGFVGPVRAKKVIHPLLKVVLLPNMVFMAWILWKWFHGQPVVFSSGSALSSLESFSLSVGENRLHTANRALVLLFLSIYLTGSEKKWKKILYGIGGLENLAIVILTNNRGSFYSAVAVFALLGFVLAWHRSQEKKKFLRILFGLLCAAACVLCLFSLRKGAFRLTKGLSQNSLETVMETVNPVNAGTKQSSAQSVTLSAGSAGTAQRDNKTSAPDSTPEEEETVIHTLSDGMSGREPIYRGSLTLMLRDWRHFLFGITHYDVGTELWEVDGQTKPPASTHNFFLQMGVAFGVPVMLLSFTFVALFLLRAARILFRREEVFPGARLVPLVALPLLLADMFDTTLTAGNSLPCALFYLFSGWTVAIDLSAPAEERSRDGVCIGLFTMGLAVFCAAVWYLYPWYRTLYSAGAEAGKESWVQLLLALTAVALLLLILSLGWLAGALLCHKKPSLRRCISVIMAAVVFIACLAVANSRINRMTAELVPVLEQERPAIEAVQSVEGCTLLVDHIPEVYQRFFGDVRQGIFHPGDLASRRDAVLITDANREYGKLIAWGFLYTEISDHQAIYTRSAAAIEALKAVGYHLTGYYSRHMTVSMMEKDGQYKSREISLPGATYRAEYALRLVPADGGLLPAEDTTAIMLSVTLPGAGQAISSRNVKLSDFDEEGVCNNSLDFTLPQTSAVEFCAKVEDLPENCDLQLLPVSYYRHPGHDIHAEFNQAGRRILEFYFTLEGEPYTRADGTQGKEFDYDNVGNNTIYRCLDSEGNLMLNNLGCAEVHQVFDSARRIIRQEYYGIDGERCIIKNGISAEGYEYDMAGNQVLVEFYDAENLKTSNNLGYAEIHRSYNSDRLIIKEEYFDINGQPVNSSMGYAGFENEYDDQGNLLLTGYFDVEGRDVPLGNRYFHKYLKLLTEKKDAGATVFIAVKDDGTNALNKQLLADLRELGLQTDLSGKYRNSYYAVIDSEKVQEALSSDQSVSISGEIDGKRYSVSSAGLNAGNFATIVIDGVDYAKNARGMNIVVFENGTVTDTVAYDTYSPLMAVTK